MRTSVLEKVTVGFRCPMNWEEMAGDEGERFCGKCQKSVTDLSAMTREEAEAFVVEQGPLGKACIRLLRDEEGNLVTKGCGSAGVNTERAAKKAAMVAVAAGGLAVAACSGSKTDHTPLMGVICPPLNEK